MGDNGQLTRHTTSVLLKAGAELTLLLRRARRLDNPDPSRVWIIEGDVLYTAVLNAAMQDAVYANLAGNLADPRHLVVR